MLVQKDPVNPRTLVARRRRGQQQLGPMVGLHRMSGEVKDGGRIESLGHMSDIGLIAQQKLGCVQKATDGFCLVESLRQGGLALAGSRCAHHQRPAPVSRPGRGFKTALVVF